jgi:heme A synthase
VPPTSQEKLDAAISEHELEVQHDKNGHVVHFELWHVYLHTAHRIWALAVIAHVLLLLKSLKNHFSQLPTLTFPVMSMLILLLVQLTLGMLVIWTGKHPEIATAHQFIGALFLGIVTLIQIRMLRLRYLAKQQVFAAPASLPHDTTSQSVQATSPGAIA